MYLFLFTADAFFKAFISQIPDIPKTVQVDGKMRSSEPMLVELTYNFLSTLLIVPVRNTYVKRLHEHNLRNVQCNDSFTIWHL